jgi:hypothetical protein
MKERARLLISVLAATLVAAAVLSPSAHAAASGIFGEVTDKDITLFCFGVIAFFAIFVTVMSLIQGHFDAKKEQRRQDLDRFNS